MNEYITDPQQDYAEMLKDDKYRAEVRQGLERKLPEEALKEGIFFLSKWNVKQLTDAEFALLFLMKRCLVSVNKPTKNYINKRRALLRLPEEELFNRLS